MGELYFVPGSFGRQSGISTMMITYVRAVSAFAGVLALVSAAGGDELLLSGGGRLSGKIVNADQSPRTNYVVELASGAMLTLGKEQVRQVIAETAADVEYAAIRHQQPDTAAGQWALAEWCKEHKLYDERKQHLARVVELEPDHVNARAALGYSKIGGRWTTQAQHQAGLGKVLYKGTYHFPQAIEIMENRERAEKAKSLWFANLKRWRDQLGGEKGSAASTSITTINDPAAMWALRDFLQNEENENVRVLYVKALSNIGNGDAQSLLVELSLQDESEEVRLTALDYLDDHPQYSLISRYIQGLRSGDNRVVNRSAVALSRFKDRRAIAPLIEALVTTHKYKVTTGNSNPGAISAGNGSLGSGLSMGQSTHIETKVLQNQAVLETLVVLAGGNNFQYDMQAWKSWYAGQKKNSLLDVRRS
jgi:hypothetical protein